MKTNDDTVIIDNGLSDALDNVITEAETEPSLATYTHVLNKPFIYEGKTYEELVFEWDKLTGRDSISIENEVVRLGRPFVTPEFSAEYLVRMAAKACTLPIGIDLLEALPLVDFNRIKSKARGFLLKSA